MLFETLMPFLYMEEENEIDQGKAMGQKEEKREPGFLSGSEIRSALSMAC